MDSFPVVLRCEDVCVAVPISILIKESTVFKTMFGIQDRTFTTTEINNDKQDWQTAPSNRKKKGKNKRSSMLNTSDHNLDFIDLADRLTIDSCSRCNAKDAKGKNDSSRLQVDLLDIEAYSGESVKILFEHLMGYNQLMKECTDLKLFADMLMLCNFYDMKSPIEDISKEIRSIGIDMESLIHAMEALEMFKHIDEYKNITDELWSRCIDLARCNFGSRSIITNFILENVSDGEHELMIKLFEHLYYDSTTTVRYMVEDVSKIRQRENNSITTPVYILRNLPFNIEVSVFKPNEKYLQNCPHQYLGLELQSNEPNIKNHLSCKWKIFNRKNNNWEICTGGGGGLDHHVAYIPLQKVLNEDNGYIKLDAVWIEAEINFSPSSHNFMMIGECPEYYLCVQDIIENNWNLFNPERDEDYIFPTEPINTENPVILKCGNVMVAIDQSILVQTSSVFKRMLSNTWTSSEDSMSVLRQHHEKATVGRPKHQFEVIEISDFDPLAVRILFEQLKGYVDVFLSCPSIHVLGQMLMLCDFYAIDKPVKGIKKKLIMFPITMVNLLEAFATAKSLEMIEAYKTIAHNITVRCISFARCNLGCSSNIIDFMVRHKDNINLSLQLFDYLGDKKGACFRYKLSLSLLFHSHEITSPTNVFRNAEWTVQLTENWNMIGMKFLGVLLKCKPEAPGWRCNFKMEIGLYNWKTGSVEHDPAKMNVFSYGGPLMSGNKTFKCFDVIQDQNMGFIKNDSVLVVVEISILD